MGLDLTLLPFDCDGDMKFSHTLLSCERRRELWTRIEKLPSLPVIGDFTSFMSRVTDGKMEGEYGYGQTKKTAYGELLRYTTVEELMRERWEKGVIDNYKNRAIWAYLAELPPETKVALYWH